MRDLTKHTADPAETATHNGELDLFTAAGDGLTSEHFGIAEDGRAFVEAPAFARALNYSSTQQALQVVDADEQGEADRETWSTAGGKQIRRMKVLYEDGMWELIFRSTLPSAKTVKSRVKEILRQLRETGTAEVRPRGPVLPLDYETALVHLLGQVRARKSLEAKVAEDAPKVAAWEAFLDRDGWLQVGVIARALG
ncbi:BRO family protein [Amycolatopsis taiwanensis]|nr:BRO family protein [Amycolatopsis taiwanensis]